MDAVEKPVIIRRDILYPRVEYRTGHLELILPPDADEQEILEKYSAWIREKRMFIDKMLNRSQHLVFEKRTKEEFIGFVKEYAGPRLNTDVRIQIRKMKSKWASCSEKRTITLNILAKDLPKHHLEYILSHEFLHLANRKHDTAFREILTAEFPDMEELEKDLCAYWFALQE